MNKMHVLRLAIAAVTVAFAFAATAAIIETTEDMTAQGDWEITVAAGDSNVVTVAQSGAGKIVKKGGGWLILRKNSTFSGGVELQAGFVMVDPDAEAGTSGTVNCTALGTGTVTILGQRDGYTGYCELGIVGAGSNDTRIVTIANPIHVTGNTTGNYPALVIYGQKSVLTGKITAEQDFCFWDDYNSTCAIWKSQYNRYLNVQSCTFGEIEAAGAIGYSGLCRFLFTGPMSTPKLDFSVVRDRRAYDRDNPDVNNAHGAFVFYATNSIGEVVNGRRRIYCAAPDVIPGILLRHTKRTGLTGAVVHLHGYSPATGYDQTFRGLVSDPLRDGETSGGGTGYDWAVNGTGGKTLTITGVAPDEGKTEKELVTCASINGNFSLVIDAYDGFTQTVSNRMHGISKTIHVKKGAFQLVGTATMSNLTAIVVDAGASFRFDSSTARALESVKTLSVEGTFVATAAAAPDALPKSLTEMRLSSSATFVAPAGTHFTAQKLYVDGAQVPAGTWTHAQLPNVSEGVTFEATSSPSITDTVEWSGAAAADNMMSTAGNWKDASVAPGFADYSLNVVITNNGTEMVYEDGMKIGKLQFRRTPAAVPFTIRPATKGAVLYVGGRIEVSDAGQLILKDATIAAPGHIDQGTSSASSATTLYVYMNTNDLVGACAESNNVFKAASARNLPVVLDNAVIEKPYYSSGNQMSGYQLLYCPPDTTNEFKGYFFHNSWWPYFNVSTNAQLAFSGGMGCNILVRKVGKGTMVIKDKPFVSASYFGIYDGTLALDAEGMSFGGTSSGEGIMLECDDGLSMIDCRRSYCFNGDCALMIYGNSNPGVVELHSTTQRVTRLHARKDVRGTAIHGDPGALLEIVGGRTDMTYKYSELTNRVDFTGALSFRLSATNETMTFYARTFSTVGDLEVSAGTLDLRSDVSWLNGTNVAVNGEGRLKIAKRNTFNGKFAELALAGSGVLEVPEGVSQMFWGVTTNGVALPSGRYTALPNGEGDFLAGGGAIVVKRRGTALSLR